MPLFKSDDDLFRESTMTFGEHLEDLRLCLFRAIAGLMAGFILGLIFAYWVVHLIEAPLNRALEAYYQDKAERDTNSELQAAGVSGQTSAAEAKLFRNFLMKNHLLAEQVYVDSAAVSQAISVHAHQKGVSIKPYSEIRRADLIKILFFREAAKDYRLQPIGLGSSEAFSIYVKTALLFGAVISAPWVFYQLWSFVAAGLYRHERYYVRVYLPFSVLLFLGGASLAFVFVFDPVLRFLFKFNDILGINPDLRISEWLNFVLLVPLCFGISFQLPLVMLFLERIGVFTVSAYFSKWRIAVLAIALLSAMLAPAPDPYSMCLLAVPLTCLYFGGIYLCKYMPRRRSTFETPVDDMA